MTRSCEMWRYIFSRGCWTKWRANYPIWNCPGSWWTVVVNCSHLMLSDLIVQAVKKGHLEHLQAIKEANAEREKRQQALAESREIELQKKKEAEEARAREAAEKEAPRSQSDEEEEEEEEQEESEEDEQ